MRDKLFSETIGELTPIPKFIERHGWSSVPLQVQLWTLALGALSFLVPAILERGNQTIASGGEIHRDRKRRRAKVSTDSATPTWRLSPFRLMLFAGFSVLSFQASRNSHQFAAVAGTVTAWNIGEWVAASAIGGLPSNARRHFPTRWGCRILALGAGRLGDHRCLEWRLLSARGRGENGRARRGTALVRSSGG